MASEKRLIAANVMRQDWLENGENEYVYDTNAVLDSIDAQPTVDAVEVVHGHWKEYSHSALVRWKDGEPVWADRSVFRCSRCDFGTIARHNYCPRCGAKMDGDGNV